MDVLVKKMSGRWWWWLREKAYGTCMRRQNDCRINVAERHLPATKRGCQILFLRLFELSLWTHVSGKTVCIRLCSVDYVSTPSLATSSSRPSTVYVLVTQTGSVSSSWSSTATKAMGN